MISARSMMKIGGSDDEYLYAIPWGLIFQRARSALPIRKSLALQ
jgi:hypothetical protein